MTNPVILTDYVKKGYYCPDCGGFHNAEVSEGLENSGITGPRLSALTGFLKGGCHASYSVVGEFLNDVLGVKLASGTIPKIIGRVSSALAASYEELENATKGQPHLNIDETGFKENGKKLWIWVFKAAQTALFKVADSRGSKVLVETLGEDYEGIVGSDFYGAYRKFIKDAEGIEFSSAWRILFASCGSSKKKVAEERSGTQIDYSKSSKRCLQFITTGEAQVNRHIAGE